MPRALLGDVRGRRGGIAEYIMVETSAATIAFSSWRQVADREQGVIERVLRLGEEARACRATNN